uniref:DUF4446 family protein n=1 Tax=Eubacterium cellulosolvens TaxID=29322 RepID=UPI000481E473|nr:DUF4446 family protein [[Eubacterium] cellulosolvens]
MKALFGSTAAGMIIIILGILVVVLCIMVFSLAMNVKRLNRKYRLFMKGTDGKSIEKLLASKLKEMEEFQEKQAVNTKTIQALRRNYNKTLTKYGIVKYDAFEDVGGKMSFALAMLDNDNTGFVLNAIHSRDNCYLYLKEIVKGASYIMLSDEEIDALRQASHVGDENIEHVNVKETVKKADKAAARRVNRLRGRE